MRTSMALLLAALVGGAAQGASEHAYDCTWRIGGTNSEMPYDTVTDGDGNLYLTGYFYDPINFASDWGSTDLKTPAGAYDIFVTKINANGSYGWTHRMGGSGDDQGRAVETDGNGNVYVAGHFWDEVNFAQDWGESDSKTSAGGYDIFVTKINADGSYGWTHRMGGTGDDHAHGLATDGAGIVYAAGYFDDTVNFEEDWGGSDLKTCAGGYDIFVTKINADGSYDWTHRMGAAGVDHGYGVATDSTGNVYVTGYFVLTVNFEEDWGGTDFKSSAGDADIFLMRVNGDGTYGWTRRLGGSTSDRGYDIAADSASNLYVIGDFSDTVDFGQDWGQSDLESSAGGQDIFISKAHGDGTYGWTSRMGATENDYGYSITLDGAGNIFMAGTFCDTVNFADDWRGSDSKTSAGSNDIFVTKITAYGLYGYTKRMGDTGNDQGTAIGADGNGNVYAAGFFFNTVEFAKDWGGSDSKTSAGAADMFVTRLSAPTVMVPYLINYQGHLKDSGGNPLNGVSVDLTFRFYDSETGGNLLLSVEQTGVQVTEGLFNVLLGSGTVTASAEFTLAAAFQKHSEVWMSTEVGSDGQMAPRQRIASVGYALKAGQADTAKTAEDLTHYEPRTTAPANPVKGDVYMDDTTNKLMVFDGTTWQACW